MRLGKFTSDGRGNFMAETFANYNGFLMQPEDFKGTYTVTKDCSVTMQYTFNGITFTWNGGVIDNGKGVDLVVGDPAGSAIAGIVVSRTLSGAQVG